MRSRAAWRLSYGMNNNRIVMFGWEFPPHNSGGLGVACRGIARALSAEGASIVFILPKKVALAGETMRFLFANVPRVRMKGVDTALTPYVSSAEYALYRRYLPSDIYSNDLFAEVARYAGAVRGLLKGEQFDIIHAHDWLSFLAGIEAKRLYGKPLVVHVHITSFEQSGGNDPDPRVYAIECAGMRAADAVIAVSERTRSIIIEKYHINSEKVFTVYNGVEPAEYPELLPQENIARQLPAKPPGWKMVLYVGRLTMHKGPDYFLHAAKRVLEFCPRTLFVIAGSGDMEWQLIRTAAHLGIAEKVYFAGFVRGEELAALYRAADLYVLPSVAEPFGITPLESALYGTPVVLSKQAGAAEVLTHALLADFWDTEEMANKIMAALTYRPLWSQLRVKGRAQALALTWQATARKIISIYQRLLGGAVAT